MKVISHRGNIDGRRPSLENRTDYIDKAISLGYDVEVDLWKVGADFYLGHDGPEHIVLIGWLDDRSHKLWVHCKNLEAVEFLSSNKYDINYFWHQEDAMTITSKGHVWSYPGIYVKGGIVVELEHKDLPSHIRGVCTDYPVLYK